MTDTNQATPDEVTEPEHVEPEPEEAPESERWQSRPRSDILGALLADPKWAGVLDSAARAPSADVSILAAVKDQYDACQTVSAEADETDLNEWYRIAWIRTHRPDLQSIEEAA